MNFKVFLQPAGDFLVIPEGIVSSGENSEMWNRDPVMVFRVNFETDEAFAKSFIMTLGLDALQKGTVGNILFGFLNGIFNEGVKYGCHHRSEGKGDLVQNPLSPLQAMLDGPLPELIPECPDCGGAMLRRGGNLVCLNCESVSRQS